MAAALALAWQKSRRQRGACDPVTQSLRDLLLMARVDAKIAAHANWRTIRRSRGRA